MALAGVVLGLVCTALLRRHFIEDAELEYPIGQAAAQTLVAGDSGGSTGKKLFGAMGLAGLFTALRDGLGAIPSLLFGNVALPGVAFGVYLSPMLLAVGFLVGTGAVAVWFAGALIGNFGIVVGGTAAGLWDVAAAQGIVSSLGMGVMMGCGVGVICEEHPAEGRGYARQGRARLGGRRPAPMTGAPRRRRRRGQAAAPGARRARAACTAGLAALRRGRRGARSRASALGLGPVPRRHRGAARVRDHAP